LERKNKSECALVSIGTRLIQIRNQKNLTQRELSERSGIASSYLSRIENRRLEPSPKTLRRIAEAMGVSMGELFQDGPDKPAAGQCAITVSGNCIMQMLGSRRRRATLPGTESYSPRQLQLLRMADYLIQTGSNRVIDTLDVLFGALLSSSGRRREATSLVKLRAKAENLPVPMRG
jgi:DNA-binding XRE family transcriptional regulator